MQPIDQTRFGWPGGNCFQAALASILELPLDDVPDFCNDNWQGDWESDLNEWLYQYGLFSFTVDVGKSEPGSMEWLTDNCYVMAAVQSALRKEWTTPNGSKEQALHSVVYHKGKVVHDPNPDKLHMDAAPLCFRAFCAIDVAAFIKGREPCPSAASTG